MSALSIEDLKREIGKNIFIHPLDKVQFKDASIDLSASQYAWSLKTKATIYNADKKMIVIPPNDTALIYTNEAINITNKICGTFHSKVTLVSSGLSHIGTTLDPDYIGLCLIAIHNHSSIPYELPLNNPFVTIMFYYVKTPSYMTAQTNAPGHISLIKDFGGYDNFLTWHDQNLWVREARALRSTLKNSQVYIQFKKEYKEEKKDFHKILYNPVTKYALSIIVCATLYSVSIPISQHYNINLDAGGLLLAICTIIITAIMSDILEHFK